MDTPEEEELLSVKWTHPKHPGTDEQSGPDGWYVRVFVDGWTRGRVILVPFARQRDAEIGKAALLRAGLDTLEKLIENKPRLREIMCSALQWQEHRTNKERIVSKTLEDKFQDLANSLVAKNPNISKGLPAIRAAFYAGAMSVVDCVRSGESVRDLFLEIAAYAVSKPPSTPQGESNATETNAIDPQAR